MRIRRGLTAGLLALTLFAGAAFVACGDDADADTTNGSDSTDPANGAGSGIEIGDITINDAWARPSGNTVGAVYMTITNAGDEDRLVSASTDVSPNVQIHEVVTEGLTQQMQEVEGGIVVPAGGSVELSPGGYHIMMLNMPEPLVEGTEISITVTFEKAGSVDVPVTVQAPSPDDDHSHHDHGDDDHDDHNGHDDHDDHGDDHHE